MNENYTKILIHFALLKCSCLGLNSFKIIGALVRIKCVCKAFKVYMVVSCDAVSYIFDTLLL